MFDEGGLLEYLIRAKCVQWLMDSSNTLDIVAQSKRMDQGKTWRMMVKRRE